MTFTSLTLKEREKRHFVARGDFDLHQEKIGGYEQLHT